MVRFPHLFAHDHVIDFLINFVFAIGGSIDKELKLINAVAVTMPESYFTNLNQTVQASQEGGKQHDAIRYIGSFLSLLFLCFDSKADVLATIEPDSSVSIQPISS